MPLRKVCSDYLLNFVDLVQYPKGLFRNSDILSLKIAYRAANCVLATIMKQYGPRFCTSCQEVETIQRVFSSQSIGMIRRALYTRAWFYLSFSVANFMNKILVHLMPTVLKTLSAAACSSSKRSFSFRFWLLFRHSSSWTHAASSLIFWQPSVVIVLAAETDQAIWWHLQGCCYHRPILLFLLLSLMDRAV